MRRGAAVDLLLDVVPDQNTYVLVITAARPEAGSDVACPAR